MKIKESNITFEFPDENRTIKFDEDTFYTKHFNKMPYSKGVGFISSAKDALLFLEVKNCTGDENNNLWRIQPNNEKLNVSKTATAKLSWLNCQVSVVDSSTYNERYFKIA